MSVFFACSPPQISDFPSATSSISSISLDVPVPSVIVRMSPVFGARGSLRSSSPVNIDINDGGLDIGDFGSFGPMISSLADSDGPFGAEYAYTRREYKTCSPIIPLSLTDHTTIHSLQTVDGYLLYLEETPRLNVHVHLPTQPYPCPHSDGIPIDDTILIEPPTFPCRLFVRYDYPLAKEPPMPTHYKFLDRNRMGDMDQQGAVSPPSRSQVMTQPPVPAQSMEDMMFATEQTRERDQELIYSAAEKIRIEKMADQGEIDWREPVKRRVRSSSM